MSTSIPTKSILHDFESLDDSHLAKVAALQFRGAEISQRSVLKGFFATGTELKSKF